MRLPTSISHTLMLGLVVCATLTGCNEAGPISIDEGRMRYNDVIEHTAQTQLLLNLIRVSQNRSPLFIDVTEVDASLSVSSSLSASVVGLGIAKKSGAFRTGSITSGGVGAAVGYSESPTIRYIPLQGQALVQQLASPISIESLPQLYDADVPLPTLLDFTVDRLTPGYYDYGAALNLIGQLDWLGALTMSTAASRGGDDEPTGGGPARKAGIVVQTVAPTPKRHTALVLYLQPGSLSCRDTLLAARHWAELLEIYASVRTEAENANRKPLDTMLDAVEKCDGDRLVTRPPVRSIALRTLLDALDKVPSIELRTEPLREPPDTRRPDHVRNSAPYLRMRSAYGIFRSIEVSDYGPTELIDLVTPEQQAAIAGAAWDYNELFHLVTYPEYCPPGHPFNAQKCKELGEIYQSQPPGVLNAIDRRICDHGRYIADLAERNPTDAALQDKLHRWTDYCGRYSYANSGVPDETVAPPPLLTMSENDTDAPVSVHAERRQQERLLRKQRRYILIVSSPYLPPSTFASVQVDGTYYYIAQDDVISQRNFRLLQLISIMESVAPAPPLTPTVSVGGH